MSRDPLKPFDERTVPNKPNPAGNTRIDDVKEGLSQVAAKTKDKASQMADSVSETLDEQRETAAKGLGRAAAALHENADSVSGVPKLVNFTHSISQTAWNRPPPICATMTFLKRAR